ncbi:MAG: DNA mismatch repair endonuclease MutL, partial [Saprospiraceae bacterium]
QTPQGTSLAVKNLFYNVPARRNFLKSDPVEMRHILDEFQHIAMAHPDLFFSLHHNDQEIFHLPPGNLRQRIVKIFGEQVNKKLVPVEEKTDILRITGFVGKPDYFKKSRGEQMFFVNKRFIKSSYLHHAVMSAYEEMLPADSYALYALFLDIDPARIDINVHPTKQEIKFDDERLVYNYLKVTVRHALGTHNITPTLDFEQEPAFQSTPMRTPTLHRPADAPSSVGDYRADDRRQQNNLRNWQRAYEGLDLFAPPEGDRRTATAGSTDPETNPFSPESGRIEPQFEVRASAENAQLDDGTGSFTKGRKEPYQIHGQYIVSHIKSGFLLIDQQAASERILYERYAEALGNQPMATQNALFPKTLDLAPGDALLLRSILPEVNRLGFEIAEFGGNSFIVHGTPAELSGNQSEELLVEKLLAQYKENLDLELGLQDTLARAMARSAALRRGQSLTVAEMQDLADRLFACATPFASPSGKNCFLSFDLETLRKQFDG